jgi:hypothetical protein
MMTVELVPQEFEVRESRIGVLTQCIQLLAGGLYGVLSSLDFDRRGDVANVPSGVV